MANSFIEVKEIARQTLPRLIENLVFPNLIYKDYSQDFVTGKGAKIQVKKPVVLTASEFNESTGTTAQDVKGESVEVVLDKLATVDVEFGAIQKVTNVDDLNRLFLEPAAVALAEKINSDGLYLYKDIPYTVGTAGTTPSSLNDLADARKELNIQKVPTAGRVAVWDPEADAKFTTIDALVNAEKSGTTQALREGSIGRVFGLDNYMAQGIKKHTAGKLTSAKIATKAKAGDTTLSLTVTSGDKLVKGDVLKVGKYQFAVAEDVDASSTSMTVKITTAVKEDINANAGVTVVADHTANLAFNPNAFAFVTRPLVPAKGGAASYTTSCNGISLRVTVGYDMKYKKEMLSMDVLYGYKTMYEELATRVLG